MSSAYLLDTNIVSALMKGDPEITDRLSKAPAAYLPLPVIAEILFGCCKAIHRAGLSAKAETVFAQFAILDMTRHTAEQCARIKARLREKGTPIPENDIYIAAIALQYDLTIATRDKHFSQVENLRVERW